MNHRVEVLRPGSTPEFDYWSNAAGTVYLCRERADDAWQAIVDGDVILDRTAPDDVLLRPVQRLSAAAAEDLVPLLAMQDGIHLILDRLESTAPPLAAE